MTDQKMTATTENFNYEDQQQLFFERTGRTFEHYYTKYYNKLVYFTLKMCNDPQTAEDISTDSFIKALEKIDMYHKDISQFSTWLFTIARNLCLMRLKEDQKSISMDNEMGEEGCTLKDFIADTDSELHIEDANLMKYEAIIKAIEYLKPQYREIIEMREITRMTYSEISEHLGICLSTTKSRIRTARQTLMKMVEDEFELIEDNFL